MEWTDLNDETPIEMEEGTFLEPSPADQRAWALDRAIASCGMQGAESSEWLVERAEKLMQWVLTGELSPAVPPPEPEPTGIAGIKPPPRRPKWSDAELETPEPIKEI